MPPETVTRLPTLAGVSTFAGTGVAGLVNNPDGSAQFKVPQGLTVDAAGQNVVVADTGTGIPENAIARVCKPFEQIDNHYSRAQGGTGLGLSIVEGLINLHGGTLTIASEVGKGTAVTVRLPRARTAARPAPE